MHGREENSWIPRGVVTFGHVAAVAAAGWLLLGGGQWASGDQSRRTVLLVCSVVYLLRACFGMLVLLKRKFDWSEAAIVVSLFAGLHATFAILGASVATPLGVLDGVALGLYACGSYLNTGSEYGRHRWKRNPDNRGKLYTGGLFRHSMHINYFGDTMLFSGFALLTRSPWAWLVPTIMTLGFVLQHIPNLDAYLRERYGAQFETYANKTKKLVPYLY